MTLRLPLFVVTAMLPACLWPSSHAAAPESPPETSLRFLFLDETPGAYSLKLAREFRVLSTSPYQIGSPVLAKPASHLELYKDGPAPDPLTGRITPVKIATVTVPDNISSSLVVLTPQATEPGSVAPPVYDIAFFNTDPAAFPARSIRILNLGRAALAAQFGDIRAVAQPGTSQVQPLTADRRNRVFSKIAVQTPAGWKLLYDNTLIVRPETRLTGVFVYSPSGLRYSYTPDELAEYGNPPPGHFWLTYADTP
ncbi:MAG TPA: hypothetical protein VIO38_10355 [Rariglobus sp.]